MNHSTPEQIADQLVKACPCWVAPPKLIEPLPGTQLTAINLPDGYTLALLKYPAQPVTGLSAQVRGTTVFEPDQPMSKRP